MMGGHGDWRAATRVYVADGVKRSRRAHCAQLSRARHQPCSANPTLPPSRQPSRQPADTPTLPLALSGDVRPRNLRIAVGARLGVNAEVEAARARTRARVVAADFMIMKWNGCWRRGSILDGDPRAGGGWRARSARANRWVGGSVQGVWRQREPPLVNRDMKAREGREHDYTGPWSGFTMLIALSVVDGLGDTLLQPFWQRLHYPFH